MDAVVVVVVITTIVDDDDDDDDKYSNKYIGSTYLSLLLFFSRSRSFSYSLCVRVVVPVYILYIDSIE
jgi:hypothetical protein